MYVLDNNGIVLNSECMIGEEDGIFGLILESQGPITRNKDYNISLEYIIERLIQADISHIKVYLASTPARKNIKSVSLRKIHSSDLFSLIDSSPSEIRQELGRCQAYFSKVGKKENPSGNRTKRIMITVSGINSIDFWESIILGDNKALFESTEDEMVLIKRVSRLVKMPLAVPKGSIMPKSKNIHQTVYFRDPSVKAWILQQSNGICELCGNNSPFKISGIPYLEVHHVIPLSILGPDTIYNCVALCPNCHKNLHYGDNAQELSESLYLNIKRLIK